MKCVIDVPLECSRAIHETERGYKLFIKTIACMKCRFPFITFNNTDLMKYCSDVEFS